MFEVMLIGLLVLVLILIPLCIGFVAIVRWIMRRTRRVSGQPPVTAAEPLPPPGAAEKGVVRTESLTAEDTFAFETSGEQGAPSEKSREPQLPVEDVVETPHNTDKAVLQDQLKDSMMFRYAVVAGIALLLLIPLLMVESLVGERSSLYREVVADISRTWGGLQQLSGPYLLVPYTERVERERVVPVEGGKDWYAKQGWRRAISSSCRRVCLLTPRLIQNPAVGGYTGRWCIRPRSVFPGSLHCRPGKR